ncbi:MAG: hypothetical protein SGJ24_03665, partial [Chloroflexota bacterium]|nr:hypothetical protein [Chloroflexota bacterium]
MANDPKKQQPNDDSPDTGSGEELPPWLRGGATPPPPADSAPPAPTAGAIPRLAPRKSAGDAPADDPSVPPWLRGLQPPEEKKVIIGGKEVSMEFFNEADSLANDSNTDMTYDAWLADQVESRREKSVEEELPDFFDAIAGQVSAEAETKKTESAYPIRDVTGGTSQLPDWFLGLEELDDTDAPDWVRQIGADATNNPAPQPPQPPDPVVDFFQDMGLPIDDDSYSDLELPSSSFFTELVGKPSAPQVSAEPPPTDDDVPDFGMLSTARAASSAPPSSSFGKTIRLDDADSFSPSAPPPQGGQTIRLQDPFGDFDADDAPPATVDGRAAEAPYGESTAASDRQSALDDDDPFAGFDLFETPDDPISTEPTLASVPEAVEISQYELDAFLDGIDPPAPMPSPDVSDIDDPDMDLFIGRPAPIAPPEAAARETPRDLADDSMNWLSEIEGIVSSATRANTRALDPNILNLASSPDARVPRSFDDLPAYTEPTPVPTPTADDDSAFSWDDWEAQPAATIDPPAAPEPENANDLDWLTGIQEEDAPHEAKTVQVDREVLARMGLLNRQTNVEVTPPDDDRETIFALPDGFNDSSATLPTPLFDAPPASSKPDSAPLQLSSLYSADIDPEAEEWDPFAEAGLEVIDLDAFDPDSPKFDSGVYPRDFDAATLERLNSLSGVAPDESAIFDAELRSGWLQDDLLDEAVLLDSVRGLDPLTPMVSPVITDDEEDALDFLRETPRALETSVDDSDDAFFALIDRASDGTAPVSTFERPDDENTIGQASTIDFGLFDSLSTELPSYTPTSAYSFADDDDEADTLDLSMFDAPSDTSGESG